MTITHTRVVIIGSGFAGLCMAIKLKEAGINDFIILEKADDVGGTWRENTYPGAECDIPTALYSYSFEQNPDWDYKWAGQKQILGYIKSVSQKHQIYDHIQFGQQLKNARYDEVEKAWFLESESGKHYQCQIFVTAVGQLHHPSVPKIKGLDSFAGISFHSAKWDHSVDLTGKKVAVIGTGASAVQFIPPVAEQAAELHIFQRSPNWIMPKLDAPYSDRQKRLMAKYPLISRFDRLRIWLRSELVLFRAMKGNKLAQIIVKFICRRHLMASISDAEKCDKLTPRYTVGAKRVLFSDNYYTALAKPNVHLHTDKINAVHSDCIEHEQATLSGIDVLIYGTGFITNPFLSDLNITGLQEESLHSHWQNGAHAYLGVSCSGFPNFFMLYGPNTNLGHNSIILMIEAQTKYIVQAIQLLDREGKTTLEVKEETEKDYNDILQARLKKMVWNEIDSWYTDGERITNNWAGGTAEYALRMRKMRESDYILS